MTVMSLRKNVPFAPVTAPAAAINSCDVPARWVTNWAWLAVATAIRKRNKLRLMQYILFVAVLLTTFGLHAKEIVIRAARVIDGRGHELRQAAVVVDGSKIVRIDPHPTRVDIDLGDRTLMPGGIDTHVH